MSWSPARVPRSGHFDDTYYSRDGGLAEKRHVFLGGCQLPGGWREATTFVIVELGFGTGLNFLSTWDAWRRTRPLGARLHYVGIEGYPLSPDDFLECALAWPELRQMAPALVRAYPTPQRGFHRVSLDDNQTVLTLAFGDAAEMLAALEAQVDAWFLDGFAPDRNPAMWSADVMAEIARLSKPNAKLSTYSVAGDVRRMLDEAGFEVHRAPGFGAKREMLRAIFRRAPTKTSQPLPPWFAHPPAARLKRGRIAVVGAGLAGANMARAMARRGWQVTVYDSGSQIAAGASGHSVGVLAPRLTAAPNLDGRFYAAAWRFALNTLEDLADRGLPLLRDRCGALELALDDSELARHQAIAADPPLPEPYLFRVSAKEASELAGVPLSMPALFFPQGGWLSPELVCRALLDGLEVRLQASVAAVRRVGGVWTLFDAADAELGSADVVVLANAVAATSIAQAAWLPLDARRGQVTSMAAAAASKTLRAVLLFGGYLTPPHRGRHSLGATFDWVKDVETEIQPEAADDTRNVNQLAESLPHLGPFSATMSGWAAIRCTMPDHVPAAGPIADDRAYLRDYAELRHGHPWARYPDATYHPGLYTLVGLGARGLVGAPLAAEIVASHIVGDPWPIERDVVTALHPGRFLVRDLKRMRV